jgi:hypothetical protein
VAAPNVGQPSVADGEIESTTVPLRLNDIEIRDVDSACFRCYFRRVPDMDRRRVMQFAGVGAFAAAIPVPLARASASKQDQLAAPCAARAVQSSTPTLFADEFDGPAGSVPDYAKWTVARGTSGDGRRNVFLDGNSNLVVRATREGDRYVGASLAANWRAGGGTTWEARVKLESLAAPCWPAQWLATDGPARVGEVDSTGWRGSIEYRRAQRHTRWRAVRRPSAARWTWTVNGTHGDADAMRAGCPSRGTTSTVPSRSIESPRRP